MTNKEVYNMKGREYFPLAGLAEYNRRIDNHLEMEGVPKKGTEESVQALKKINRVMAYHAITGAISIILPGIVMFQGLEGLLK